MSEVMLKVPAEHVGPFRQAIAREVKHHGEWVDKMGGELLERFRKSDYEEAIGKPGGEPPSGDLADVTGSAGCLAEVVRIAKQAFPVEVSVEDEDGLEVRGNPDALAHLGQTMVREVLPDMIDSTYCPFDDEVLPRLKAIGSAMTWGAEIAVNLHALEAARKREAVAV
jgi:hypothetical protein